MREINKEFVIYWHEKTIKDSGGTLGLLNDDLLESALNAPFQTFDNKELYPTVFEKAARYAYGLIKNHPFADGNKRIGVLVMQLYLFCNGIKLTCNNQKLIDFGLSLAKGDLSYEQTLEWVLNNTKIN
jgi:death-on-curing protein